MTDSLKPAHEPIETLLGQLKTAKGFRNTLAACRTIIDATQPSDLSSRKPALEKAAGIVCILPIEELAFFAAAATDTLLGTPGHRCQAWQAIGASWQRLVSALEGDDWKAALDFALRVADTQHLAKTPAHELAAEIAARHQAPSRPADTTKEMAQTSPAT